MTTCTLTTEEINDLAQAIATDGPTAHTDSLCEIADLAEAAGLYPGATAILRDTTANDSLRNRAFFTISRNWSEITSALSRWAHFRKSFDELANQWDEHEQLRTSGDIASLWNSRIKLDALRAETALARGIFH